MNEQDIRGNLTERLAVHGQQILEQIVSSVIFRLSPREFYASSYYPNFPVDLPLYSIYFTADDGIVFESSEIGTYDSLILSLMNKLELVQENEVLRVPILDDVYGTMGPCGGAYIFYSLTNNGICLRELLIKQKRGN